MHTTKCLEIFVRFVSPNHQGQRISRTSGDTRTQYLKIEHDSIRLHIAFCDKDGDEVSSINFNSAQVLEYTCEGYVR
jgi:hypothetical protein